MEGQNQHISVASAVNSLILASRVLMASTTLILKMLKSVTLMARLSAVAPLAVAANVVGTGSSASPLAAATWFVAVAVSLDVITLVSE